MLMDVRTFRSRVDSGLDGLVDDLMDETGFGGEEHINAWTSSLPRMSDVLGSASLDRFHVQVGTSGGVNVEYRLPSSGSWCDVVLLGRDATGPSVVIVELKNWMLDGDEPGVSESLVMHRGAQHLHPSDQVRGYVDYCSRFHSAVLDSTANVSGCVFFTAADDATVYRERPHDALTRTYPVFSIAPGDLDQLFPAYLSDRLLEPDPGFARAFDTGIYKQDRSFVRFVADSILGSEDHALVLLDEQRRGFEYCRHEIARVLAKSRETREKTVIIVEGPPGSGKSVLAAKLWASIAGDDQLQGSAVFVTTSGCQKTVWKDLFQRAAERPSARGIVIPANQFNPGLTTKWVKTMRERGFPMQIEDWHENLRLYLKDHRNRVPDDLYEVAIVDEAHALIDPTAPNARGVNPSGWTMHAGPQAWHIIRSSQVSIFFTDGEQSYRDNETTTPVRIVEYARDSGVEVPAGHRISLAGQQFRCAGSTDYLDWLESMLGLRDGPCTSSWFDPARPGRFALDVHDTPVEMEDALRRRDTSSIRIVASYARPWVTKNEVDPHSLPPELCDFCIPYESTTGREEWSRIWNFAPKQDYTLFIRAPEGSAMHDDPLAEVGCPYVVRGFDYDFIGLLWLSDLVRRGDQWVVNLEHCHESAWRKTRSEASKERERGQPSEANARLCERLQRGYRILLSRAIRGMHVWFEDAETRAYVESSLQADS